MGTSPRRMSLAVRVIKIETGRPSTTLTEAVEHPAGCPTVRARVFSDNANCVAVQGSGPVRFCMMTLSRKQVDAANAASVVAGTVRWSCCMICHQ